MHFAKTYSQLLLSLPPELAQSAVQYRQLKKLINQVVAELSSLGLPPDVLHNVVHTPPEPLDKGKQRAKAPPSSLSSPLQLSGPRLVYEFANDSDRPEPRLRLYLDPSGSDPQYGSTTPSFALTIPPSAVPGLLRLSRSDTAPFEDSLPRPASPRPLSNHTIRAFSPQELIIPLPSDATFFRTLSETLEALSTHLSTKRTEFETSVQTLCRDISSAARPSSSSPLFHAYSPITSDAATISVSSRPFAFSSKSDLETWREVFQMYMDADIFRGHQERFRGERTVEDAEARLNAFYGRLKARSESGELKFKLKQSRVALKTFVELNTFIMDLRKLQHGTSEATRKILKKHAKRTALPIAPDLASPFVVRHDQGIVAPYREHLSQEESLSLSLVLIQAITEILLPIIPHIDDYACVICTSLAFKPIRLHCGHLFCVRCLVKLQKRGEQHCPMCRASTVLSANRSNVDWALLNFMKDWFPSEARKKLHQNEREAAKEQMEELGLESGGCLVM
ncbi:SPX domain-containing protein [Epithele typhae]|uniref:SPX domain-containing protein n=1 Tax=Epithele typhae TaxID=378194 RepID=UPI0020072192|nr:SPX domain-containing protein [Epithele typhae]KAH9916767.1 SPX domain-containing protein [Epithele typhae]